MRLVFYTELAIQSCKQEEKEHKKRKNSIFKTKSEPRTANPNPNPEIRSAALFIREFTTVDGKKKR